MCWGCWVHKGVGAGDAGYIKGSVLQCAGDAGYIKGSVLQCAGDAGYINGRCCSVLGMLST